jgi:HPt (histidine-containing phosphotransfer) domain-containing protein
MNHLSASQALDASLDPALLDPALGPILDCADGLERVMGDRALYTRMLGRFRQEYAHTDATLRACLDKADDACADRLAHTLKGAAGMIGAPAVQAAASALEDNRRAGTGDRAAAVATLKAAMAALLDVLDRHGPRLDTAGPEASAAGERLGELMVLLEHDDGAAVDLFEQQGPALKLLLGAACYVKLETAMEAFDFAAALALLRVSGRAGPGLRPGTAAGSASRLSG